MAAQVNVDGLIRQTRRYEFSDGLRELQLGVMFLFFGVESWIILEPGWIAFIVNLRNGPGQWAVWVATLLVVMMPGIAAWGMLGLMNYLRRRRLWRESGMVKPSRRIIPLWVNLFAGAVIVGALGLAVALHVRGLVDVWFIWRILWIAIGWSTTIVMVWLGRHIGLVRYVWLGAAGGLLSSIVLFLPLTFGQTGLVFGILWGLILTLSGLAVLRRNWQVSDHGVRD
jgi:hypothetical protein